MTAQRGRMSLPLGSMSLIPPATSQALRDLKNYIQSPPNRRIASIRPPPGRRRPPIGHNCVTILLSLVLLFTFSLPATAFDHPRFEIRRPVDESWENDIVFDSRPSPIAGILRRQLDTASGSTASEIPAPTSTSADDDKPTSASATDATESGGIIAAPTPTSTDLPKAFDGGLGTNYTQPGCLNYLRQMTRNDTFNACLPVSLLLQVRAI